MTNSMDLITKRSNRKQKASFSITNINNQDFRKLLKNFKNSPYLGFKSKQFHNELAALWLAENYMFNTSTLVVISG